MSTEQAAQIQTLGAAFAGFTGVVGLGGFLILSHGGAVVKAPAVSYAPVDASSGLSVPAPFVRRSDLPSGETAASSPAPLLSADVLGGSARVVPAQAAVSAAPAARAGSVPFAAPRLVPTAHLDIESSASSSASMSAGTRTAYSGPAVNRQAAPVSISDRPKSRNAVAAIVHYGVSSRADLMGRAAGPVYNFASAK